MSNVTFKDYFQHRQALMASEERSECRGPLSNGEYAISYYDDVRILIFPHLTAPEDRTPIMDFVCIPEEIRYPLTNKYVVAERLSSKFPFTDYFYGDMTIERSFTYTSTLRFSVRSSIYSDFSRLDKLIEYIRTNIHNIMSFYDEIEKGTLKDDPADHPMRQTMQNLKNMF